MASRSPRRRAKRDLPLPPQPMIAIRFTPRSLSIGLFQTTGRAQASSLPVRSPWFVGSAQQRFGER